MRDLSEERRLAILAVCASEWRAMLADAVAETHALTSVTENEATFPIEEGQPVTPYS